MASAKPKACMHVLQRLPKPWRPSAYQNGRPWRYRCTRCKLYFKIATGVVTP